MVVTTSILGDVVGALAGEDARVEVLMAPGIDPHAFEPSARQAAALREADLVVANGLGLEERLEDGLAAAEAEGAEVLRLAEHLDPLEAGAGRDPHADEHDDESAGEHDDDGGDEHDDESVDEHDDEGADEPDVGPDAHAGHDHGPLDPHVWHDPVRMADGARVLADALARAVPEVGADAWDQRGDELAERLLEVHDEVETTLAAIPAERRVLITAHDSFGYLAARYGLEVAGTVVPGQSSQAEASARALGELAETMEREQASVLFASVGESDALARRLADEVEVRGEQVEVVELHSDALGEPGSGAATYPDLLRDNAQRIADALT